MSSQGLKFLAIGLVHAASAAAFATATGPTPAFYRSGTTPCQCSRAGTSSGRRCAAGPSGHHLGRRDRARGLEVGFGAKHNEPG